MQKYLAVGIATVLSLLSVSAGFAQSTIRSLTPVPDSLVESYLAQIGPRDIYNSSGVRLTAPWQIIRQDRANYHRFGIRDPLDFGDSYFADARNRARMEQMLMAGSISPVAARDIVSGDALVLVEIHQDRFDEHSIHITVAP